MGSSSSHMATRMHEASAMMANATSTNSNSNSNSNSKSTNPFFVFLHEYRRKLVQTGAAKCLTMKQIASMAGERWRAMAPTDKLSYIVWARKNQQQADPKLKIRKSRHGRAQPSATSTTSMAGRRGAGALRSPCPSRRTKGRAATKLRPKSSVRVFNRPSYIN